LSSALLLCSPKKAYSPFLKRHPVSFSKQPNLQILFIPFVSIHDDVHYQNILELSNLKGLISSSIGLGTNVGRWTWTSSWEVAGEEWVESVAEEDLSTAELWEGEPQDENELEEIVEWKPVGGVQSCFKDTEEGEANPVGQPLGVVGLLGCEESLKRVVGGDNETSEIDKELTSQVKEDQDKVQETDTTNDVDLWNIGLLLEVDESGVF
jgi:hypothetical protein